MKYSCSIWQNADKIKLADEIMLKSGDIQGLYRFVEEHPDKTYIVRIAADDAVNWTELAALSEKINIICALETLKMIDDCKKYGLKYYWAYPINSFFDLRGVVDLGVCYVLVDAPLYFELDTVASFGVPIRLIANWCYESYIPRENGIKGPYVRPEDVSDYEKYVDVLEFRSENLKQEGQLLTVYAVDKEWNGNLNMLLTNFKFNVDNRGIPKEFAKARMVCRQTCMRNGTCHMCDNAMKFSRAIDKAKSKLNK